MLLSLLAVVRVLHEADRVCELGHDQEGNAKQNEDDQVDSVAGAAELPKQDELVEHSLEVGEGDQSRVDCHEDCQQQDREREVHDVEAD